MNRIVRTASALVSAAALAVTLSLGSTAPAAMAMGGTSTVYIHMLGCDHGANPAIDPEHCTRVLEDDGTMYLNTEFDGGWMHAPLGSLDRLSDGTYAANDLDAGVYYFTGLEPHNFNAYAFGSTTDVVEQSDGSFYLDRYDFAEIWLYYYNDGTGPAQSMQHTTRAHVGMWGCNANAKADTAGSWNGECANRIGFDGVEYFVDTQTGEWVPASQVTMLRPNTRYQLVGFEPIRRSGVVIEQDGRQVMPASDGSYYVGTTSAGDLSVDFFYFG